MKDLIINLDLFSKVAEIELSNIPNQEFNININNKEYKIDIRTFVNDISYITIIKDDRTLVNLGNIKTNLDLLFLSGNDVSMFFLQTNDNTKTNPYNYLDFNNMIRLYYGII